MGQTGTRLSYGTRLSFSVRVPVCRQAVTKLNSRLSFLSLFISDLTRRLFLIGVGRRDHLAGDHNLQQQGFTGQPLAMSDIDINALMRGQGHNSYQQQQQ